MNEPGKIIIAGLLGAVVTLLVTHGITSAIPRPIVHAYVPEPEPAALTEGEKTKMREEAQKRKVARLAKQQALAQQCIDKQGAVAVDPQQGLIACILPTGVMPPPPWLEGKWAWDKWPE